MHVALSTAAPLCYAKTETNIALNGEGEGGRVENTHRKKGEEERNKACKHNKQQQQKHEMTHTQEIKKTARQKGSAAISLAVGLDLAGVEVLRHEVVDDAVALALLAGAVARARLHLAELHGAQLLVD